MNNRKVFEYLTDDEKTSMSLHYGMDKSTWQAGEIMNKSHYKYLEIKYRAEYFVKLFTSYIKLYDRLIPSPEIVDIPYQVRAFLCLCIEQRKKTSEAYELAASYIENNPLEFTSTEQSARTKITKQSIQSWLSITIHEWSKSANPYHKNLLNLVKEFDRWNNFRILPKALQEPSAFKRRIKKNYKKHLEVITQIKLISVKFIESHYLPNSEANKHYLPCLPEYQVKIVCIEPHPFLMEQLNKIGLYVFKEKEVAVEYVELVLHYVLSEDKTCKEGLVFWPKYRDIITRAINYKEVNQISVDRKYLKMATSKLEFFNQI